jgi:nicotinamide-nucleotide amidase
MNNAESIATLAEALVGELINAGQTVVTAESCTGGWIAKSITDIAGSSQCFGYGIVSYSNTAKESLLGVDPLILDEHGAVSEQVVRQMASGALKRSGADFAVAVSGIAGPDGGTQDKPVGTVWLCWANRTANGEEFHVEQRFFRGDRESIRAQTVLLALQGIRERLRKGG